MINSFGVGMKKLLLLASVFITGTAVLAFEIVAIRILSPFYGNTIYTTSSVIGIILAALSLGYYLGGRLSDRFPKYSIFYGIIFLSGTLVILIYFFSLVLLPLLSMRLSVISGPFLTSILLFFIPAFFLGMLSPFAIKLNNVKSDETSNVGTQSGEVFFWSTAGSIAGSLITGFYLIPAFGISTIMIFTGICLNLLGLAGFFIFSALNKKHLFGVLSFFVLELFLVFFFMPIKAEGVIYQTDGIYEKIMVREGDWAGRPVRFLFQDRSYSSAMHLDSADPKDLVYNYSKYYELYKLFNQDAKDALVIGAGAYSIPKALLAESKSMSVDVSEIEPGLYDLAKKYFNLKEDSRLQDHMEDGRHLLAGNSKEYDIIISDVYYSIFSMPVNFTTKEFFTLAKSRLSENGVFIGNFTGNLFEQPPSLIMSEIKTFKSVFENSYYFGVESATSSSSQNLIFLGVNGEKKIDWSQWNNPEFTQGLSDILAGLPEKNIDVSLYSFTDEIEITDNYAPIEHLVRKVIEKWSK